VSAGGPCARIVFGSLPLRVMHLTHPVPSPFERLSVPEVADPNCKGRQVE
jgi:hypothetical protein